MKDNLQFRVSAELKNILGRDLITSPDIAVLELVKNSYDAHATKVEITFDDDYLSIADNGKGMSKDDLINKWLFVAYSAKSDGTEDKSYRSKFKRHYAGAKGIGRMSCDRLARNLKLTTRSLEENKEMAIVTPTSHDNGVDGIIPEDALGLDKIYIQAKRYTDNPVSKPEIHKFIGALDEQKATKGVFITTSKFTSGAKETAEKASKKIVLIDGKTLADYMIEYNVGVSEKKVYEVKKLDTDYFEE